MYFDEYSMISKSKWYPHLQKTLPFLVGTMNPDERPIGYRSLSEIGVWDYLFASEKDKIISVQENYDGPLVAGLQQQQEKGLCYGVNDLKVISGRIKK